MWDIVSLAVVQHKTQVFSPCHANSVTAAALQFPAPVTSLNDVRASEHLHNTCVHVILFNECLSVFAS